MSNGKQSVPFVLPCIHVYTDCNMADWWSEASKAERSCDHVQESQQFEGQVLVAREAEGHKTGGASHVVDHYEPVAGILTARASGHVTL